MRNRLHSLPELRARVGDGGVMQTKMERQIFALSDRDRQKLLEDIAEVLWPGGKADAEWSADTASEIAETMYARGVHPRAKDVRYLKTKTQE